MKVMSGGDRDNPEADDEGADGDDPATCGAVMGGEGGGLAGAENLAADTDGHEENAEDEGGPSHGLTFVPYRRWMREEVGARSEE
jgi:hypothetical protein